MDKISKILLAILVFNLILIVNVFASDSDNLTVEEVTKRATTLNSEEYEYVELENVTYINPLYEDEVNEEDINKPSDIMMLSIPADCKNVEEAGEQLREGLKERNETIVISYISNRQLDGTIYNKIAEEAMKYTGVPTEGDYILWQYAGWNAKGSGYIYSGTYYYTLTFTFGYYTNYEQEKEMDVAVSNLLNTLNLTGTDYEKITAIYDYICNSITYDNTSTGKLKHTAYAALINKTAVCQGYAILFYRLALENNIDVRLISGTGNGGPHGWNIVKIENLYYNVDSTWDATYAQNGFNYKYYMLTDSNFSGHVRDNEYLTNEFYQTYPMGSQNYTAEMNEIDKNKPKLNGLIWNEQTGYYSYYENGNINTKFTGLYEQDNEKWYVISGKADFKYNGIYVDLTGTYIIKISNFDKNLTTVIKIDNIWRIVKNGVVDYKYTGMGTNENGTWLLENGKVTFNYTGNYKDTGGTTYIVEKSEVMTKYTTVMKIDNVWRMVKNGVIDYTYTGIGTNENGTWYLKDGTVKFNYTGTYYEGDNAYIIEDGLVKAICSQNTTEVIKIDGVWRIAKNGVVDYNYTGIGTNANGTWLLQNGKVTFNYTGIYKDSTGTYLFEGSKLKTDTTTVMKIDGVWRMVKSGVVDYSYTGIGTNENGTWYIREGKVTFKSKGTYTEGEKAYIVEGSKVYDTVTTSTTKVIKINNVWRMVINGEVDYNYTGIGTNENGTWYVKNGIIDFTYTGTCNDGIKTYIVEKNEVMTKYTKVMKIDGIWRMVINGVIDYSYTGIGTNENGTWYIEAGAVKFDYTGTYFEGDKAYIIEAGKVIVTSTQNTTKVIKINNVWRMIINGFVNYNYTGIGKNENGTWLVENGKVTFNYTGNYVDANGKTYKVQNSKIIN